MSPQPAAETIGDAGRLAAIEPAWWDLWRRTAAAPFQSPAWLLPWWDVFAPGRLASVALWQGERLCALAPLYREEGTGRLVPLGLGPTDYLDVLIDADAADADAALAAAILALPGWTRLDLEEMPPGAAADRLAFPALDETRGQHSACPVLDLAASSEPLEARLAPGKRRKLAQARNRAARRGGRIERIAGPGIAAALDRLFDLHEARWQTRGESGVLADPAIRRFHHLAAAALDARGLLHLAMLHLDGRPAGVFYGLRRPGAAYAYIGGFDPGFAFESPGTLLMADAIAAALAEGAAAFHFLRGREAYKYEWGAVDRLNSRRSLARG